MYAKFKLAAVDNLNYRLENGGEYLHEAPDTAIIQERYKPC
jgi:hypothetical protein